MDNASPRPLVAPQMWKLWVSFVGLLVAGGGMYAPALVGSALGVDPALLSILAVVAGIAVFVSAWIAVRCPGCRLSLVGHALSNQHHTAWLGWLISVQACPRCGYSTPRSEEVPREPT